MELQIDPNWMAAFRLVVQDGRTVVAEVRLFPLEKGERRAPGMWSAERIGDAAVVPPGGITAALMREIPFRPLPRIAARYSSPSGVPAGSSESKPPAKGGARKSRRGRKPRPDIVVAAVAKAYVDAVNTGKSPLEHIGSEVDLPDGTNIRDVIHQARKRGFLSPTSQGRVGGELTPRALRILKRSGG